MLKHKWLHVHFKMTIYNFFGRISLQLIISTIYTTYDIAVQKSSEIRNVIDIFHPKVDTISE